jgi:hypothetical protein
MAVSNISELLCRRGRRLRYRRRVTADASAIADGAEAPLPATDRIAALDVLRGFALLGIFIMNMPGFSHSLFAAPAPPATALDALVAAIRDLLFAGKFNLLFGLVFGIGFAIQMGRLGDAERARARRVGEPERPQRPLQIYRAGSRSWRWSRSSTRCCSGRATCSSSTR